MKIIANEKWFIGAVDFYDYTKGFGYIATNGTQSYYVDTTSFAEASARMEHCIVVFQIARQDDGKKRAVNVRKINNEESDLRRILEHFPSDEIIRFKKGGDLNIIKSLISSIPKQLFIERVITTIKENAARSPETTLGLFRHYIELYPKKGDVIGLRAFKTIRIEDYIFDRDFDGDSKADWMNLFSNLTKPECNTILSQYPTCCKFFSDEELLDEFVRNNFVENVNYGRLCELHSCLSWLPEPIRDMARNRIEENVDKQILAILNECAHDRSTDEKRIEEKISPLLRLTTKNYDEEKKNCLAKIMQARFDQACVFFKGHPDDLNNWTPFFGTYERLGTDQEKFFEKYIDALEEAIGRCAGSGHFKSVSELILKLTAASKEKRDTVLQKIYPIAKNYLCKQVSVIDKTYFEEKNRFFDGYNTLIALYDGKEKEDLRQDVATAILESKSVLLLLMSIAKGCDIFKKDEALGFVSTMVDGLEYEKFNDYLNHPVVIEDDQRFSEIFIDRAIQLFGKRGLEEYYGDNDSTSYSGIWTVNDNCDFWGKVKQLCEKSKLYDKWVAFVLSRSNEDLVQLYRHKVFEKLTEQEFKAIVGTIELSSVQTGYLQWYNAPRLIDHDVILELCQKSGFDLFPKLAERLVSLDLSEKRNLYLAVLLTELLAMDRPDKFKSDYYEIRNWETTFKNRLWELKNNNSNNKVLSTILWAVHFQTTTSLETLTEIFAFLPPYIQIRCVKKLFQLIDQGKIKHTAESLYNTISKGDGEICLPLEIVFEYLKLRESNPTATLTNETMLQLLDGRNDHREWIGIRSMMRECNGRVWMRDLRDSGDTSWRDSYYSDYVNGLLKDTADGVIVFVPRKMIDENGNGTQYNNKHFQSIQELIRISYEEDDYQVLENNDRGVKYLFKPEKKYELFGLARAYKFDYGKPKWASYEVAECDQTFCECRLSNKLDNQYHIAFNWCGNKPCLCTPLRFRIASEWENYTVLDFMRILHIPTDYVNAEGKQTRFGYFTILSSYLISFAKFYEHLTCRECGKLMKPENVSNFAYRAVTQFACTDESCKAFGKIVYLNHCFNKMKCNATIDSRDSKTCPNGQYICPECGACCSTENYRIRLNNLKMTGGEISKRLIDFVNNDMGHWEKNEYYCYRCGGRAVVENGILRCTACQYENEIPVYKTIRPILEN